MTKTTRRAFVNGMSLTAAAGVLGISPRRGDAEPPPETTRLRIARLPYDHACMAPGYMAEELLQAEGFTDIQYVTVTGSDDIASGRVDLGGGSEVMGLLLDLEAGVPVVAIGGVHAGCFELFGTNYVRSVRDLRNRTIAVSPYSGAQALVAAMALYVGLDPRRDTRFVSPGSQEAMQLLADGKIDAMLAFPPEPQELRKRKIGHVVVSTRADRPWSQYFCCMIVGNRDFVRKHPVAVKRAMRAILKSAEACASSPERVASAVVAKGLAKNLDHTLDAIRAIPYGRWREFDAEDTVRFYALRLREAGLIKSSPQKLIAQGTDWRFLNELKRELKV
jgi:NitT/TauT family transport system substrate-binding protein